MRPDLLDDLDLSIIRLPLFSDSTPGVLEPTFIWRYRGAHQQAKVGFWSGLSARRRFRTVRAQWAPQKPVQSVAERLKLRDHTLISDARIEELQNPERILREPKVRETDWKLVESMKDCAPQFSLRNLSRKEFDVNLERPIEFTETQAPHQEAFEAVREVRTIDWPAPEFIQFFTSTFFADFNTFLEETLYLCPWSEIPSIKGRHATLEGTSWDPNHSRAKLSIHLLDRNSQGTVFAFTPGNKSTEVMLNPTVYKKRRELRIIDSNPRPLDGADAPLLDDADRMG
jgi:hypothetical protein